MAKNCQRVFQLLFNHIYFCLWTIMRKLLHSHFIWAKIKDIDLGESMVNAPIHFWGVKVNSSLFILHPVELMLMLTYIQLKALSMVSNHDTFQKFVAKNEKMAVSKSVFCLFFSCNQRHFCAYRCKLCFITTTVIVRVGLIKSIF